jgi:hypothetical protein
MRKLDMHGIQATLFYYHTFVLFLYGDIFALKIEICHPLSSILEKYILLFSAGISPVPTEIFHGFPWYVCLNVEAVFRNNAQGISKKTTHFNCIQLPNYIATTT